MIPAGITTNSQRARLPSRFLVHSHITPAISRTDINVADNQQQEGQIFMTGCKRSLRSMPLVDEVVSIFISSRHTANVQQKETQPNTFFIGPRCLLCLSKITHLAANNLHCAGSREYIHLCFSQKWSFALTGQKFTVKIRTQCHRSPSSNSEPHFTSHL